MDGFFKMLVERDFNKMQPLCKKTKETQVRLVIL